MPTSPEGALLRIAYSCLAGGFLLAAYEFWRSIGGPWGRPLDSLIGLWVVGDVVDTVISINPVGGHIVHGTIHVVVAVVGFSAVAATVLAFLGWVYCHVAQRRLVAVLASALALVTVVVELSVTVTSATSPSWLVRRSARSSPARSSG